MDPKKLETKYIKICNNIADNKIADAFFTLNELTELCTKSEHKNSFAKLKETYSFMLKFSFAGVKDPERPKIYKSIQKSLLELADKIKQDILSEKPVLKLYSEKKYFQKQMLVEQNTSTKLIDDLSVKSKTKEDDERKQILNKLFKLIWFSDNISEDETIVLKKHSRSKKLLKHEKSVIVSAITISLLRNFDIRKFHSLFDFYDSNVKYVWNRALVGLILGFYFYNRRLPLYQSIINRMKLLNEDVDFDKHFETILLQSLYPSRAVNDLTAFVSWKKD